MIVPVFGVRAELARCVESLRGQTAGNLEIILVDDGSQDGCAEICDDLATQDARVRVAHLSHAGVSAARNAGLRLARGEYLTFVDGDDWVHQRYVEYLLDLIDRHDAEVSTCGFVRTNGQVPENLRAGGAVQVVSGLEALGLTFGARHTGMTVLWGKLYRSALWNSVDHPVGRLHEDEFTTHKILHRARRVVLGEDQLYFYYKRSGSIMQSELTKSRAIDAIDAYRERLDFVSQLGLTEVSEQAAEQLFRKCLEALDAPFAADDPTFRNQLMTEMSSLAARPVRVRRFSPFLWFMRGYVASPQVGASALRAYRYVHAREWSRRTRTWSP